MIFSFDPSAAYFAMRSKRGDCPAGSAYYTCVKNGFNGCCTVDPCDLDSCPREVPSIGAIGDQSPTALAEKASPTTDSGVTHTIPNSSVVTVTQHTTIFSEAPLPTETSTIPDGTAGASLPTTSASQPSSTPASGSGKSSSTGAIVGGAVGGIIAIMIVAVILWAWKRKRTQKQDGAIIAGEEEPALSDMMHNDEKFQNPARDGGDPFAPFGGRIDQPKVTTFEMDGMSGRPVELPAAETRGTPEIKVHEAPADVVTRRAVSPATTTQAAGSAQMVSPVTTGSAAGTPKPAAFPNQWKQYEQLSLNK